MDKISVVIVDDHPLFRRGVEDVLAIEPDFLVVGRAINGEDGLKLIRASRPLLAIVDVNLPGINGHQVTRQINIEKIPTRVILLTAYDDAEQKMHALSTGAAAYCTKDIQPERFIEILRKVAFGIYETNKKEHDPYYVRNVRKAVNQKPGRAYRTVYALDSLSYREMEVLTFITQGKSNKEIATILGISHQTVKNHITAILQKLNLEDRTQAAIYALRQGWVRLYQRSEVEE